LYRLHHRKEIEKTDFFVAEKKLLQTQIISNLIEKYGWKPIFDSLARNYLTLLVGWINEFFKKKKQQRSNHKIVAGNKANHWEKSHYRKWLHYFDKNGI
jgi:hypothetical protein